MKKDVLTAVFEQPSLPARLMDLCHETLSEIRNDPRGFIRIAMSDTGRCDHRRSQLLRLGLSAGFLVYAASFFLILLLSTGRFIATEAGSSDRWSLVNPVYSGIIPLPPGNRPAGGGGGGDRNTLPASIGERPPFAAVAPVNAPTTRPQLKPPSLSMNEWLLGDPALNQARNEAVTTGIPAGVPGIFSDGSGSGHGIGDGADGGVGPGRGPGFGPGRGGGTGGDQFTTGGRPDKATRESHPDTYPVALNRPRPNYTAEAQKNKVTGIVQVRAYVDSSGVVRQVVLLKGLPDGLDEEAVRAARQIRFRPGTRNGRPVDCWVTVSIEFNLR